jgi:predicted transposase/invertase (TIGR01784 family)
MKKRKSNRNTDPLDIRHFLNQPHDKFVRTILQHRELALQIIEYAIGPELFDLLDIDTLRLTNTSFIDEKLQINLADICYEGETKDKHPFRICLLFEHKSDPYDAFYEQLNRYISNIWLEDRKQQKPLRLSIPILIHHGTKPVERITPKTLFPSAPAALLRYVPAFDYIILDVAAIPDETIENLRFWALRNVFLALKHSRNEKYLEVNWKKFIIFASDFKDNEEQYYIIQATITYMISVSETIQKKFENLDTVLSPEEKDKIPPFVFGKYFLQGKEEGLMEGMEKGMEKMLRSYLNNNPSAQDEDVARLFDIELHFVQQVRKTM